MVLSSNKGTQLVSPYRLVVSADVTARNELRPFFNAPSKAHQPL